MKGQIRNLIRRFGYDVSRIKPKPTDPVSRIVPINVFPLVVEDLLQKNGASGKGQNDFFFIQIGAHDGLHYDPIRPYVKKFHWKGILVEPQPEIFRLLTANYADEPQLILENVAISTQDGEATLYRFQKNDSLPEHATMLASFNRDALVYNGHNYRGEIEELKIPALSLNTLLARHQVKRVDLLQIDTEGYDFEIIKMLEHTSIRPEIIHFESAFLDKAGKYACDEFLHGLGYQALTIGIDTLAYHQADDNFVKVFANESY